MKKVRNIFAHRLGLLVLGCATAMAGSAAADIDLVFGAYAADKPTTVVKEFKPVLTYLENKLTDELGEPVRIRMKIAKEYEDSIQDLAGGAVDFARFGPASYITAKDMNPAIRIIVMELKDGKKRFNGVIAVHSESDIQSLQDLAGHSFAFGDPLSTIGRYLSQAHLVQAGIHSSDLSRFDYLGRHDLVGTAVGSGDFDAGALKESTFAKLVSKSEPIRALFEFENVTKPWLARAGLDETVFAAMQKVMLASSENDDLRGIAKDGFARGDDADYDFVRTAMRLSQEF